MVHTCIKMALLCVLHVLLDIQFISAGANTACITWSFTSPVCRVLLTIFLCWSLSQTTYYWTLTTVVTYSVTSFVFLLLLRSQFQSALSEQLLCLTQLLAPSLLLLSNGCHATNRKQLLHLFDLIYIVLNPEGENDRTSSSSSSTCSSSSLPPIIRLSSQSLCRVLQTLLSHYFSLMKMAALSILKSKIPFIKFFLVIDHQFVLDTFVYILRQNFLLHGLVYQIEIK